MEEITDDAESIATTSQAPRKASAAYRTIYQHQPFQESVGGTFANPNPCETGAHCNIMLSEASGKKCLKQKKTQGIISRRGRSSARTFSSKKGTRVTQLPMVEDKETIYYNVERPLRAAVRMQFLMQSTKVKLNDSEWMENMYSKLVDEEDKELEHTTTFRHEVEKQRVKRLVLDGKMPPPPDMKYLYKHPVFRVTRLLKQLDEHNKSVFQGQAKITSKITPVEPYEFNGDKFFQNLHANGTYWVPSEELIKEEKKLAGKIRRAKLRLRQRQTKEDAIAKLERRAKRKENEIEGEYSDVDSDEEEEEEEENDDIYWEQDQWFEREKMKEFSQEWILEKQRVIDKVFRETKQLEDYRHKYYKKMRNVLGEELAKQDEWEDKEIDATELFGNKVAPFTNFFLPPPTPPDVEESTSFYRLRTYFDVRGRNNFNKYRPLNNPLIEKYVDASTKVNQVIKGGIGVTEMYFREESYADTFVKKLNRDIDMREY